MSCLITAALIKITRASESGLILTHDSARRYPDRNRESLYSKIKDKFIAWLRDDCLFVGHWHGKLMPWMTGKLNHMAIRVPGESCKEGKLLGKVLITDGSGKEMAEKVL